MNFFFENTKQKTIDKKNNKNTEEIAKHNCNKISDLQNQSAKLEEIAKHNCNKISDLQNQSAKLIDNSHHLFTNILLLLESVSKRVRQLDTRVTQIENRNNKHIEPQNCGTEAPPLCIYDGFQKTPQAKNNHQRNIMNNLAPKLSIEKIPPVSFLSK